MPAVFREYILRVLKSVFRGSVRRILYTPSISGFDAADTPVLAVLLLLILPALAVFRPSVLLILPVLAVFRPSVLLILPVLAVRNVLDARGYSKCEVYWEHLCNNANTMTTLLDTKIKNRAASLSALRETSYHITHIARYIFIFTKYIPGMCRIIHTNNT